MLLIFPMSLAASVTRSHATPAPKPAAEPPPERRARQAAQLRHLTDLSMEAAETAAEQIRTRQPVSREFPSPTLALARASNTVIQIIALENRLLDNEPTARTARPAAPQRAPAAADPRRILLRKTLHKTADTEPERAARTQLRRMIDERIDDELSADPDLAIPIGELLFTIADELGLPVDPAKLPDEILGLKPPPRPATDPLGTRSALWAPPYIPDDE